MEMVWRVYERTGNSFRLLSEHETKRAAVKQLAGAVTIVRLGRDYIITRTK